MNMPEPFTLASVLDGYDPARPFVLAGHAYDRLTCDPTKNDGGGLIVCGSLVVVKMLKDRGFEDAGWEVVTNMKFAKAYDTREMPEPWRRDRPLVVLGEQLLGNSHSKTSRMARRWRLSGTNSAKRPVVCIGSRVPEPKKMFPVAVALGVQRAFGRHRRDHDIHHFHVDHFMSNVKIRAVRDERLDELNGNFRKIVDTRFQLSNDTFPEASLPLQSVLSGDEL